MRATGSARGYLREIRRRGYALSDQEADRDVRAVISKRKLNELSKLVLDYSQKISAQLGYFVERRKECSRSDEEDRDRKKEKRFPRES